jgi:CreA protein
MEGLFSVLSVVRVGQVHLFYRARLLSDVFAPGHETLEAKLFTRGRNPWDEIAFARCAKPSSAISRTAYDDPKVTGVTCYVSRAKTGGIKGAVGLAEDKAEASIACRQVGPVNVTQPLPKREEVYSERLSILFKRLRVVRMVDPKRNTLVYLTYSDLLIDGSPKNSITAVPIDRGTPIPLK